MSGKEEERKEKTEEIELMCPETTLFGYNCIEIMLLGFSATFIAFSLLFIFGKI